MSWMPQDNKGDSKLKSTWEYRDGMEFVTILPNTTRDFILLQGDNDPTKTWNSPKIAWVHEFKNHKGSFSTIICNKWKQACPCCYENERYKQKNPNYRNAGGRLPYGLSKKALIQVYDFQEQRVLWILAGKQIQDGIEFVFTKDTFDNRISITRIGEKLNTNYRVDINKVPITQEIQEAINQSMVSWEDTDIMIYPSDQEFYEKSGMNPYIFFQKASYQVDGIDISSWGPIPSKDQVNIEQTQSNVVQENKTTIVNSDHNISTTVNLPIDIREALDTKCQSGIYVNQSLEEIIIQTGKTYLMFLSAKGQEAESIQSKLLIDNWELIQSYIDNKASF